ncbi:NAD(P)H-binding protein [Leucobacter sp. USCH14]|uniref:SDR family oxidoreductase n=1 Tax=Leucobacter sp. USCH14 TaxID=3024838 RepID=UPI00309FC157
MRIAIAGGTGTVGRHVTAAAEGRGHEVRVLSRAAGVDLATGAGLDLTGIDAVIDVSGTTTQSESRARAFFEASTRHLLGAGRSAGVRHHVALSIVGVDRAPFGYYAGKAAQEHAVANGPLPWTVLRATQFHEFAAQMIDQMRYGPVVVVPKMRTRPVAARTVSEHLVRCAEESPAGFAPELAGPREDRMSRMVRALAAHRGIRAGVLEVPLPGRFGRALRDGGILPSDPADAVLEGPTFAEWLRTR